MKNLKLFGVLSFIALFSVGVGITYATTITRDIITTTTITASDTITNTATGKTALRLSGIPALSANSSLLQVGQAISGGSANGTYIGANPVSFSGNFFDLQIAGSSKFKVDASGNVDIPAGASFRVAGVPFSPTGSWTTSGNNIYSNNSGNVGIGTTVPVSKLEVNGTVNLNNAVKVSGGNTGIGVTVPVSLLEVGSSGYLQFSKTSSGSPTATDCDADNERGRMVIDTTGNVLYICNGASRGWDSISLTN